MSIISYKISWRTLCLVKTNAKSKLLPALLSCSSNKMQSTSAHSLSRAYSSPHTSHRTERYLRGCYSAKRLTSASSQPTLLPASAASQAFEVYLRDRPSTAIAKLCKSEITRMSSRDAPVCI